MIERFEDFCFNEDVVDVAYRSNVFRLYYFNGEVFPCLFVLSQVDVSKASLSQFLAHLVLTKATAWVEILPFGSIEYSFIFDIFKIVFEVLSAIRVEESYVISIEEFLDVIEGYLLMSGFDFEWLLAVEGSIIDEELDKGRGTIFYYVFFSVSY